MCVVVQSAHETPLLLIAVVGKRWDDMVFYEKRSN